MSTLTPVLPLQPHDFLPILPPLQLTILMLLLCPHDLPPTLPPHVRPHPSLRFGTPTHPHDFSPLLPLHIHPHSSLQFCSPVAYHPHAPDSPLTQPPRSALTPTAYHAHNYPLTLPPNVRPHTHSLPCLHSRTTLNVWV
ncbi:hypothetical protein O181_017190 [Austropuccinia psidii MF-1]|uniref:Uncharacterized protein n=1 Tax=Austropuccinia psidii MF-1 TaxID=1389203 RepID=A0A9Q3GSS1_9BASI|nr:hypothetical protein [Austropuccinia psidii MF-1]